MSIVSAALPPTFLCRRRPSETVLNLIARALDRAARNFGAADEVIE
jgi:hypothetical protein